MAKWRRNQYVNESEAENGNERRRIIGNNISGERNGNGVAALDSSAKVIWRKLSIGLALNHAAASHRRNPIKLGGIRAKERRRRSAKDKAAERSKEKKIKEKA